MKKFAHFWHQPCMPLGKDGRMATGSAEHIALSLEAACEGMVLLKNKDKLLPLKKDTTVAIFGTAQFDYVRGGGGSGDSMQKTCACVAGGAGELTALGKEGLAKGEVLAWGAKGKQVAMWCAGVGASTYSE